MSMYETPPSARQERTRPPGDRARTEGRKPRLGGTQRIARGLGWFSVGLGAIQLLTSPELSRLIGVRYHGRSRRALLAVGGRELATGVGILTRPRPASWLWLRVAGDAMDLALLANAMRSRWNDRGRIGAAMGAVAGVMLVDGWTAQRLSRTVLVTPLGASRQHSYEVTRAVTINRSPEEVYRFCRDLRNLPRFMAHLDAVEVIDELRSRWRIKPPGGATIEWQAEIVDDRPGARLAWRSAEREDLETAGVVRLQPAPGRRGTEVRLELRFAAPRGRVGKALGKLFGRAAGHQAEGDLRRLKQLMETGHVVTSEATVERGRHPGRPPAGGERRHEERARQAEPYLATSRSAQPGKEELR